MGRVARWLAVGAAAIAVALLGVSAVSGAGGDTGWLGFGNTPDNHRYSPLTQIDRDNVSQLGRMFTVDFKQLDPTTRRGNQSFPVISGDTMYVTTNDDNIWALDATSGKLKWRWGPDNVAVFRNFGIVANRGVALCDGSVYILTLDMTIARVDADTGKLIRRVPISQAVPRAASNYGYSETSAPICANHRIIIGAAGSEYGVRGFIMAYRTDLSPAWANPFWTIPPEGTSWRRASRVVGGGVSWTPQTVDTSTNTVYFGTGSATPLWYPQLRPGNNPRADSLIAVDLRTGKMKWWQQQMAKNQWSYDTAQPPVVYTGRVGGHTRKVVSVATMEGVWFCYDARTGRPIYQRVKVIDRVEHPPLQPGKPVVVYPSALGGVNYSPAAYDPKTNYIFNSAAETAAIFIQTKLTPTQKKRKLLEGDVFLGLQNGDFGQYLPGWHDRGSVSAIDVNSGKRVWKFPTPEPGRGGVSVTAAGIGFAPGGDGVFRAFDTRNGKILWTFQTGHQMAGGASIYAVDGKEYVAVTSGGTPTSSNGGISSELQVFSLGGSQKESPPPSDLPKSRTARLDVMSATVSGTHAIASFTNTAALAQRPARTHGARATVARDVRIIPQKPVVVRPWLASSTNLKAAFGRVLLGGKPVVGAAVRVDGFTLPYGTGKRGGFSYELDVTQPGRHAIKVVGTANARVNGRKVTDAEAASLRAASGGFSVGYKIDGVRVAVQKDGTVVVRGRVHNTIDSPAPPVVLYTYQLQGTITDVNGNPVQGAYVTTRTNDRDFWTFSSPSDASGHYVSFFHASDETSADPVTLNVGVALNATSYGGNLGTPAKFDRDKSARLDIKLGRGSAYTLGTPQSYTGAIYDGLVVGVTGGGGVVKPISARWPDIHGRFSFVLPGTVRGKTLHFWENRRLAFSTSREFAGGPMNLASWPVALGETTAAGLGTIRIPRR